MKQLKQGDVIAVELNGTYYYAIVLTPIIMFGGNLVYAFPFTTKELLKLDELLSRNLKGFNSVVDFIFAKRENRIIRLGSIENYSTFKLYKYFKACHELNTKSNSWFIYDENNKLIKRTNKLTIQEKEYPFWERIDDTLLAKRIVDNWFPEKEMGLVCDKCAEQYHNEEKGEHYTLSLANSSRSGVCGYEQNEPLDTLF